MVLCMSYFCYKMMSITKKIFCVEFLKDWPTVHRQSVCICQMCK